ncbi:MAG: cytidine deaminase [Candidatus Marinimicrobia bacterium]|nr:cytidine deaminase [Candidatus Neomarinimicrobiota bacterium]
MIDRDKQKALLAAALNVRSQAYAPYSKFTVGAAVLSKDGSIVSGINMENSSYGLSVCAERNTLAAAVAQGKRDFEAMAVVSKGGVAPCGACRQVIHDICGDIEIILADEKGAIRKITSIQALLHDAFGDADLKKG